MRKYLVPLAAVAVAVLLAGCGGSSGGGGPAGGSAGKALKVVATTTQVQDFTRVIGGDRIELSGILKPGVDAHDYEPSPADLDAIARADVLVINGVGLEKWLDDTVRSAGFHGITVDASEGVRIIRSEDAKAQPPGDPHIWQDPRNAKVMVANIEQALVAADATDAAYFKASADAYSARLDALDASIAHQIDSLADNKLVTNHDAFAYYVARYHLDFVGSIIPSFDTSAELSARDVSDLVARIRASGVKAIFSESSLPPRTAETIAREAHVKVVEGQDALYGDALGPAGSQGATYLQMMEHNTRTIVANLAST
ncbi:MAG TPA: metal ABC transporter substrate-binding protein [Actinomycetota bacterium]|nr:metal ABC transporter substrate-binding protein [Actinomycetota bacterium]